MVSPNNSGSRIFTPGSGCKAGRGERCGGSLKHLGLLQQRDDGTFSCNYGRDQVQKMVLVACSCGCGEMIEESRATRLGTTYIASYFAGELDPYRVDSKRVIVNGEYSPEAKILAFIANIEDATTATTVRFIDAHVRPAVAMLNEGVQLEGAKPGYLRVKGGANMWIPVIATALEVAAEQRELKAREREEAETPARPIIEIIKRVLRGEFVERGKPKMVDGERFTQCATAANGGTCLGDGWANWAEMPAWQSPNGKNNVGFCPACAAAVAHKFHPVGFLENLITGMVENIPMPADPEPTSVHTGAGTAADRIDATVILAETHLSPAAANRIVGIARAILNGPGGRDGVSHGDADRLDQHYFRALAAQKAEEERKAQRASNKTRAKVRELTRNEAIHRLERMGASQEEILEDALEGETPKQLLARVRPLVEARLAAAKSVEQGEGGESAPEPQASVMELAWSLAKPAARKGNKPLANPSDRHYGESRPAQKPAAKEDKKSSKKNKAATGKK